MVFQAKHLSMRANMLTMLMRKALEPRREIMSNSNVILQLQQMRHILDEVQDLAEWMDAIKEVICSEIDAIPEPVDIDKEEENVDWFLVVFYHLVS